jgi:hypothetical protein
MLGLPANEDGWEMDLILALVFGVPAAVYGLIVFLGFQIRWPPHSAVIALCVGCLNGLILAALISGTEVVSERAGLVMAWVGLALLLIGPVVAATLSHLIGRHKATAEL